MDAKKFKIEFSFFRKKLFALSPCDFILHLFFVSLYNVIIEKIKRGENETLKILLDKNIFESVSKQCNKKLK